MLRVGLRSLVLSVCVEGCMFLPDPCVLVCICLCEGPFRVLKEKVEDMQSRQRPVGHACCLAF